MFSEVSSAFRFDEDGDSISLRFSAVAVLNKLLTASEKLIVTSPKAVIFKILAVNFGPR